jgi:hypothetical protein
MLRRTARSGDKLDRDRAEWTWRYMTNLRGFVVVGTRGFFVDSAFPGDRDTARCSASGIVTSVPVFGVLSVICFIHHDFRA